LQVGEPVLMIEALNLDDAPPRGTMHGAKGYFMSFCFWIYG
jgi:hypothetical protein